MSFVDSNEVFVNRSDDLKKLGRDILKASQNTVCILYAAKGVGKTALIQKVVARYAQKHTCVSVNPGLISSDVQGGYIQAVFHALFRQSTSSEIDQYFMSRKGDELKLYAQFLLGNINEHTFWGAVSKSLLWILPLWVSLLGIDIFTVDSFLYQHRLPILISGSVALLFCNLAICISKSDRVRLHRLSAPKRRRILEDELCTAVGSSALPLQLSYIQSKLREGGHLLHLTNIQKMDNRSQQALVYWIQLGTNAIVPNYFFLEYQTDDDSQTAALENFLKNSSPNAGRNCINVEKYRLANLSDQHILELAGKLVMLEQQSEDEICLYWKEEAKGDLFEIIRFIRRFGKSTKSLSISKRFNSLTKQQKFVLLVCFFAQPTVPEVDVIGMTRAFCPNVYADLKVLEIEDFIETNKGILGLHGTDLSSNWERLYQDEQIVFNAAKTTYDRYYWTQLKQTKCGSVDYYRIVESLLHFYSKYYTQRLDNILAFLAQNANISYNRDCLERSFSELLIELQQNNSITKKTTWSLVSYCYNLELYRLAFRFLSLLADDDSECVRQ